MGENIRHLIGGKNILSIRRGRLIFKRHVEWLLGGQKRVDFRSIDTAQRAEMYSLSAPSTVISLAASAKRRFPMPRPRKGSDT